MRILFVDDEKSVLEGIENRLRRYRKRWDMDFSTGGVEALTMMRAHPFDAIVSDMRMPGMDGAELLGKIRDEFAETLRIVLTGQTAKEQILRSIAVAHRVLNKPCDAVLLEAAIADATEMQSLINNKAVKSLIDNIKDLPALPKLHLQLTELIKSGEYDIQAAAGIVEQDPVIAGRVLQLVNSSYYSLAREVVSIKDAVSYLGTDSLRGLILNLELFSALENTQLASNFSLAELQHHSLLTAQISTLICEGNEHQDLVYTAALLHDIGRLVLAYVMPTEYDEVLEISERNSQPLVEAERDAFGFTHADVSAYLLSLWDLPFPLIHVVGNHHERSKIGESQFSPVGLVHIASEFAKATFDNNYGLLLERDYLNNELLQQKVAKWSVIVKEAFQYEQH